MKRVFIVDYTTNDAGDFKIYEIQNLLDSNLFKTIEEPLDNGIITASFYRSLASSTLRGINPHRINYKTDQRYLLQSFEETAKYNPDFMIIDRESKEPLNHDEKEKIRSFLLKYANKSVIKTDGVEGNGNTFTKDMEFEAICEKINWHLARGESISIEKQVMLTKEKVEEKDLFNQKYQAQNCAEPGIFRRDIAFYDADTDEIEHFEVYKQIIDVSETTCNHLSDQRGTSISKGYLEDYHTIDEIRHYTDERKERHPERYQQRENFFRDIARVVDELGTPNDECDLSAFCLSDNDHRVVNEKFMRNQGDSSSKNITSVIRQKHCAGIQKITRHYQLEGYKYISLAAKSDSFLSEVDNLRKTKSDSSDNIKLFLEQSEGSNNDTGSTTEGEASDSDIGSTIEGEESEVTTRQKQRL
ncbi:hypothetical protein L3V82_04965 [Thiotrichales bacterium 19S3-7]|nr:hypothetical protein [Thiotrichales bacterium 19S3-7]MCF6801443.1 hypothetical protein [Thiotrichales bacterium 19S3-11]